MTNDVYVLIGVPASGKTWVAEQLRDSFTYVPHDDSINTTNDYVTTINEAARTSLKPLLIETPFGVSRLLTPLHNNGYDLTPVFIFESHSTLIARYRQRDNKPYPARYFANQDAYRNYTDQWNAFRGTSDEVLAHLKEIIQ